MSTFEVRALDNSVKMSDRALAVISDVLGVLSASDLIFPERGEVFLCDSRGQNGFTAVLTPQPGRRRRISRSVCVPVAIDFETGSITPGPSSSGFVPFTNTAAFFVRLAKRTGAELMVKTYYGWMLDEDLRVEAPPAGPRADAIEVVRAISESGREIKGYHGIVRLSDGSILMIFGEAVTGLLAEYVTARLAAHEHYERMGIPELHGTRFAAIFRADGAIIGVLSLHQDGTASPYILPDFRGGIGLGLVRLLWERKKSVLTAPACDVERFYKAWGFLENKSARHEHGLVELTPPTVHDKANLAVTVALIAPQAKKVLVGLRAGANATAPDHWSLPMTLQIPDAETAASSRPPDAPISFSDNLKAEFTDEHYVGYPEEVVFKNRIGFFVLPPELEEKYLAEELFPRTPEYRFFRWVSIPQALTLRPMTIETRTILRRIMSMLKN